MDQASAVRQPKHVTLWDALKGTGDIARDLRTLAERIEAGDISLEVLHEKSEKSPAPSLSSLLTVLDTVPEEINEINQKLAETIKQIKEMLF